MFTTRVLHRLVSVMRSHGHVEQKVCHLTVLLFGKLLRGKRPVLRVSGRGRKAKVFSWRSHNEIKIAGKGE